MVHRVRTEKRSAGVWRGESESVGGRSGGDSDGDDSGKRHGAADDDAHAMGTDAEDATNESDVIGCLRGVTNSPVNFLVEDSVEGSGLAALDQGGADLGSGTGTGGLGGNGEKKGGEIDTSDSAAILVEQGSDVEMIGGAEEKRTTKKKGRKRKRGPRTARLGHNGRQMTKKKKKREEDEAVHQG